MLMMPPAAADAYDADAFDFRQQSLFALLSRR